MHRTLFMLALLIIATGAQAEIFKCKKPSGETAFSDTPCKAGSNSEVVPDREHLSKEQQDAAQKNLAQKKKQASDKAAQRAAAVPPKTAPADPAPQKEVGGGGCYDGRGPRSNCAGDLDRRPQPADRPGQLPADRPSQLPAPRPRPR